MENNNSSNDDLTLTPRKTTTNFSKLNYSFSFSKRNLHYNSSLLYLPTSVFALFLITLLVYNSFSIYSINLEQLFSNENGEETNQKTLPTSLQLTSNPVVSAQEEPSTSISAITQVSSLNSSNAGMQTKQPRSHKPRRVPKTLTLEAPKMSFSKRVRQFFNKNSCDVRVFMTWISSLDSFGEREKFTIESLFKFHPNACLLIISESLDTEAGTVVLRPFLNMNFRIMAIPPDYKFVFKYTMGAAWYEQLMKGKINPGEIAIGQNLSNLLRHALLYKYGGIYMDTDFIILKSLVKLRNSIGAQNVDYKTKAWTRLNCALMIFDKKHPLLNKFIEEFALTFNGNKWGHNGPYLVSRVIERLIGNKNVGDDFTILPPLAFYPVDWFKIGSFYQKPTNEVELKWVKLKLKQLEGNSYAMHLWNRQSKGLHAEDGSIMSHLMKRACIFCNSSTGTL